MANPLDMFITPLIKANLKQTLSAYKADTKAIKAVDSLTATQLQEAVMLVNNYSISVMVRNNAEKYKREQEGVEKGNTALEELRKLTS